MKSVCMNHDPSRVFPYKLIAAPMAGVSSRAFREIVRQCGADLAYGEMISARALGYGNKKTWELMDIAEEQAPRLVQISGCEPAFVALAAREAAELGAQLIDLNMGCPVPKVARNNEGCMLMSQPRLAAELVAAARESGLPVSCKLRAGWDDEHKNAVELARVLEAAGASFIAVHGRTRQQFYSGQADWSIIAQVKQALSIPVVGNGDIVDADSACAMLQQTNCDGLMVGRAMLGNPWIFRELSAALNAQPSPPRPTEAEIISVACAHLRRHVQRCIYWLQLREGCSAATAAMAENLAVRAMRNHLGWYTKGMRHAAQLRCRLHQAQTVAEVEQLFGQQQAGEL